MNYKQTSWRMISKNTCICIRLYTYHQYNIYLHVLITYQVCRALHTWMLKRTDHPKKMIGLEMKMIGLEMLPNLWSHAARATCGYIFVGHSQCILLFYVFLRFFKLKRRFVLDLIGLFWKGNLRSHYTITRRQIRSFGWSGTSILDDTLKIWNGNVAYSNEMVLWWRVNETTSSGTTGCLDILP